MIALQTTGPASTSLSAGVDANQALTWFQWLESRGPYALVALVVIAVIAWLGYWIPKWVANWFARWDRSMDARGEDLKAMRAQHEATLNAQQQRYTAMLETFARESQSNRESFARESQADRVACADQANRVIESQTQRFDRIEDRIDRVDRR